jgi:transcriptional regulator with XRE-family HTH domain
MPAKVRAIRQRLGVSQCVFAALLGVSTVLVQSWEQGVREPSALARRLLGENVREPRRWQRMAVTHSLRRARRRSRIVAASLLPGSQSCPGFSP